MKTVIGSLRFLINADVEDILGVGLVLQPGAAVGDDGSLVELFAGLVEGIIVVDAGGPDQLGGR